MKHTCNKGVFPPDLHCGEDQSIRSNRYRGDHLNLYPKPYTPNQSHCIPAFAASSFRLIYGSSRLFYASLNRIIVISSMLDSPPSLQLASPSVKRIAPTKTMQSTTPFAIPPRPYSQYPLSFRPPFYSHIPKVGAGRSLVLPFFASMGSIVLRKGGIIDLNSIMLETGLLGSTP